MAEVALVAGYVLSLIVVVAHFMRHFPHLASDGVAWYGWLIAAFLLLCPGINTLLALDMLTTRVGDGMRRTLEE